MKRGEIIGWVGKGSWIFAIVVAIAATREPSPASDDPSTGWTDGMKASESGRTSEEDRRIEIPPAKTRSSGKDQSFATRQHRAGMVLVGGHVRDAGTIRFTQGMTLYDAIEKAGGATEFGSIMRVVIHRDGKLRSYNLKNPELLNPTLEANDQIHVPMKMFIGS